MGYLPYQLVQDFWTINSSKGPSWKCSLSFLGKQKNRGFSMSITRLHHICGISTPGRCSNPEKPEPIKKGLKLWGGLNSEVVVFNFFFHCDFHPYCRKWSNLTQFDEYISYMVWNKQLDRWTLVLLFLLENKELGWWFHLGKKLPHLHLSFFQPSRRSFRGRNGGDGKKQEVRGIASDMKGDF